MPSPRPGRQPIRVTVGSTVVEFIADGDRWRHRVTTASDRWESIEGAAAAGDPRWPASPVLVDVSLATVAGRPAALGMGMAGRSHFSLAATACPWLADAILFEAACRIHEPAAWLGSTYRSAVGLAVIAAPLAPPPATISWRYVIGPRGLAETPLPQPRAST